MDSAAQSVTPSSSGRCFHFEASSILPPHFALRAQTARRASRSSQQPSLRDGVKSRTLLEKSFSGRLNPSREPLPSCTKLAYPLSDPVVEKDYCPDATVESNLPVVPSRHRSMRLGMANESPAAVYGVSAPQDTNLSTAGSHNNAWAGGQNNILCWTPSGRLSMAQSSPDPLECGMNVSRITTDAVATLLVLRTSIVPAKRWQAADVA